MEMSRGLLVIIALLAMGMCWDVAIVAEGGSALSIGVVVLIGRAAAIGGIFMRTRAGWFMAIGFFVVIIVLNLMAADFSDGGTVLFRVFVPVLCAGYLFFMRSEFE